MPRQRVFSAMWRVTVLFVLTISACGRPHVKGTVAVDTILKAWQAEGFDTASVLNLDAPDVWNAGACSRGIVGGLEVLLCEYASDEPIVAGEEKVMGDWAAEAVATGAVTRTARTILAVSDRAKVDPEGRTIARLAKTFRLQR